MYKFIAVALLIFGTLATTSSAQQSISVHDPGFKHPVARQAHRAYQQAMQQAWAEYQAKVAEAQAAYLGELDRAAELCRRGGYTEELAKIDQAKREITAIDIADLQQQLADAQQTIDRLTSRLQATGGVPTGPGQQVRRITDRDVTPQTAENLSAMQGSELLVDGYVVNVSAVEGDYRAIIAAGSETTRGRPIMVRSAGGREYQVQVHVAGDRAAELQPGNVRRRVRGIVKNVRIARGEMYDWTELAHYAPQTSYGLLIVIELENPTIF